MFEIRQFSHTVSPLIKQSLFSFELLNFLDLRRDEVESCLIDQPSQTKGNKCQSTKDNDDCVSVDSF